MSGAERWTWEREHWRIGPTLALSEAYQAAVRLNPDMEPATADLPVRDWSVVVFGMGSMNTMVKARTAEEAGALAIASWEDGSGDFDETMFGHLDADADPA